MSDDRISKIASQFFARNYDYLWLRTMLEQAANTETMGSTLITGSSHALNGIKELLEECLQLFYALSRYLLRFPVCPPCFEHCPQRSIYPLFYHHGVLHSLPGPIPK